MRMAIINHILLSRKYHKRKQPKHSNNIKPLNTTLVLKCKTRGVVMNDVAVINDPNPNEIAVNEYEKP